MYSSQNSANVLNISYIYYILGMMNLGVKCGVKAYFHAKIFSIVLSIL